MELKPAILEQSLHVSLRMIMCTCGKMVRESTLEAHKASLSHVRSSHYEAAMLTTVVLCSCNRLIVKGQVRRHLEGLSHMKQLQKLHHGYPKCACGLAFNGPKELHFLSKEHVANVTALDKQDFETFVRSYYGHVQAERNGVIENANNVIKTNSRNFEERIKGFLEQRRAERRNEAIVFRENDLTGSVEPCHICLGAAIDPVQCSNPTCHGLFCRECAEGMIAYRMECPRRCQPGLFHLRPFSHEDIVAEGA